MMTVNKKRKKWTRMKMMMKMWSSLKLQEDYSLQMRVMFKKL
jgi:hypothetical protein